MRAGVLAAGLTVPAVVWAQNANQFGGQDRADAAQQMTVLAVQQAISSLPPTSAQSFTYAFDLDSGAYTVSQNLGPTVLRSPETIGAGKLSVRVAASYFALDQTFGPIEYGWEIDEPEAGKLYPRKGLIELGLASSAKVGLVNLGATYGLTNKLELMLNLPIVAVDAQAENVFTTLKENQNLPANMVPVSGPSSVLDASLEALLPALRAGLNSELQSGKLIIRSDSFSAQGFRFNDGTHAGVGRISAGAKLRLYDSEMLQLAAAPEFFFPSPNQDEFAGPDSAAILPRLVAAFNVAKPVKLMVDAGYDYDFRYDELSGFVWTAGATLPLTWASFDLGFGGTKFNRGITWTPSVTRFQSSFMDAQGKFIDGTAIALGDNQLGTNYVDVLVGMKLRLGERSVIAGAVSVPVTGQGFQPAALGTLEWEMYF